MAHSLSSKKRIRQNEKRRMRNRARKSNLKTTLRRCTTDLQRGPVEGASEALRVATRMLDRAVSQGTLHRNAAARRKSRLARRLNVLRTSQAAG